MAAESIIVTKSDGSTDLTFNKISQNGLASRWAMSTNTYSESLFIDIEHKMPPMSNFGSDIHNVTLRREKLDTDTNRVSVAKVSLQITSPKGDQITTADIGNDLSCIMSLFKTAFMDGFVKGQTPSGDYNVSGPFNPVRT
jgi:hypothetical protein